MVGRRPHAAVRARHEARLVLGADAPAAVRHVRPARLGPAVAPRAAAQPARRVALGVRAEPTARHRRLDGRPELGRVVRLDPVARLLARVVPAEHLRAADVGGERLYEHEHGESSQQRAGGSSAEAAPVRSARLHPRRDQLRCARQRQRAEHRERRVGRQQPASEVTRLHAQVHEERERHRHEHQAAHQIATQLQCRADQRGERGSPAEPPGEAVEVVGDAARLLPRLRLVRRHLGLVAQVAPPGVE